MAKKTAKPESKSPVPAKSKAGTKEKAKIPAKVAEKSTGKSTGGAAVKPAIKASSKESSKAVGVKVAAPKKSVKEAQKSTQKELEPVPSPLDLESPHEAADVENSEGAENEVISSAKGVKGKKAAKLSAKLKLESATAAEIARKWQELKLKYGVGKAPAYNMTATFEANSPLQHKIFGWGYITNNDNDRLEVLFEAGVKHLISNYRR